MQAGCGHPGIVTAGKTDDAPDTSGHDGIIQGPERAPPPAALHVLYILMRKTCYHGILFSNMASLGRTVRVVVDRHLDDLFCNLLCPVFIELDMHSTLHLGTFVCRDNFGMKLLGNLGYSRHDTLH